LREVRIIAESSGGVYCLPMISTLTELLLPADDLVGHHLLFLGDLAVAAAHEALDRVDGVGRIGHGLPLRRRADEAFAVSG
jgi:hypothetical protein